MNVRLIIENEEIELNNKVQFAITKSFDELFDPTKIINDWSKTVNIPGTLRNNKLFSHFYNPNQVVTQNASYAIGVNFDPSKKLDFRLEYNGMRLLEGYAKMTSVTWQDQRATYNITLNGTLGKIFQELKKITFAPEAADPSSELHPYYIDGTQYFETAMDKTNMKRFFEAGLPIHTDPAYYVDTDIIGFAPNNAFTEDFDYHTYQNAYASSKKMSEVLEQKGGFSDLGLAADTIYPNGISPRAFGEYRSWCQLPFVYIPALWNIFTTKAKTLSALQGYDFEIEPVGFQSSHYFKKAVMMLNPLSKNDSGDIYSNIYQQNLGPSPIGFMTRGGVIDTYTGPFRPIIVSETYPIYDEATYKFALTSDYSVACSQSCNFRIKCTNWANTCRFHPDNMLNIIFNLKDNNGTIQETYQVGICDEGKDTTGYAHDYIVKCGQFSRETSTGFLYYDIPVPLNFVFDYGKYGANASIEVYIAWSDSQGYCFQNGSDNWRPSSQFADLTIYNTDPTIVKVQKNVKRSFCTFTLNDLWNHDVNIFDQLLKYFKMFHMHIYVDEDAKKVRIVETPTYFSASPGTVDWTSKLDTTQPMTITPVFWADKYVDFTYDDSETRLGQGFKKEFGHEWGTRRISTNYNFNTESLNILEGLKQPLISSDSVLSWESVYARLSIQYTITREYTINNKDDDGKETDVFGTFLFNRGSTVWDDNTQLRVPIISDDTTLQRSTETYFYSQSYNSVQVSGYQQLAVDTNGDMFTWGVPEKSYSKGRSYSNCYSFYKNFWEKWINERYNLQTKLVTAYILLEPYDFLTFTFNTFVRIGDRLYAVNKIYDYDITDTKSTKVDLITIGDKLNYTTNNYRGIDGSPHQPHTNPGNAVEIQIVTNDRWTVENNNFDFELNGVVTSSVLTSEGRQTILVTPHADIEPGEYSLIYRSLDNPDLRFTQVWTIEIAEE